ncbi:MAG: BLUF domain-containing protein [Oceanobacter sp.]
MEPLIRLVYASYTQSKVKDSGIDPVIGSILSQSRRNNSRDEIGGVLFHGDGFFFQCLEGRRDKVDATFERIKKDDRHKAARIIRYQDINDRMFEEWSMKFVPAQEDVLAFLKKHGHKQFRPYQFSDRMIDELLVFLRMSQMQGAEQALAAMPTPPASKSRGLFGRIASSMGL